MNKQAFLDALGAALSGLPPTDIEDRLAFYGEMLDDKMEAGLSEEEAVSSLGKIDEIVSEILSETPLLKIAKERMKPRRRPSPLTSVLLILGSPIWLSLLIAAFSVVVSVYLSVWSVIVSFWAVFVCLVACVPAAIVAGIIFIKTAGVFSGLFTFSAALVSAGLAIFCFFGCVGATKYTAVLTKRIVLAIKKRLIKKEEA